MSRSQDKVEVIFDAALELTGEERQRYVARACGDDEELRRQVERLLRNLDRAGNFLTKADTSGAEEFGVTPSGGVVHGLVEAGTPNPAGVRAPSAIPGDMIGRYKLLEKIGEGGFGIVYLAEQKEPVKRRVALKIIKLGMDTKQVVARFEAERQALALMDHPNIAKVHDGGATESGRPYFVMELVRGVPITNYCDENRLSTSERLQLFMQVCQAVQHAHQKGIIHRDLKPSNILVTVNDGRTVPKIIDFGIAKATQGRLTDHTLCTAFQQVLGTPAYMSPEQALLTSLDIDTRSDIYSLGVLLYELLTGKTPFDAKELLNAGLDEMRRTIREKEPVRPSTRISFMNREEQTATVQRRQSDAQKFIHVLRGDLDWIVMKCLEKDRSRRYDTANGLAADLQRHLSNETVVARPSSAAYQFRKFVRRHDTASITAALIALAVLLGVIVSTWALLQERAARAREQAALKQANQRLDAALAFVDKVFKQVAPEIADLAGAATAQEMLAQSGLDFVQRLREGPGDDPALRLALARLLYRVSAAQNPGNANTLGNYETGLKRAKEALELLGTGTLPMSEAERVDLLFWVKFAIVQCLCGLGRFDEAVEHTKELEPLLDQLERFPDSARWARRNRMSIRGIAGEAVMKAGRPMEAITNYFRPLLNSEWAQTIMKNSEAPALDHIFQYELEIIMGANNCLASAYLVLTNFEAMLPPAAESVRLAELLAQRYPGHAKWAIMRTDCRGLEGLALMRNAQTDLGLASLRKAREEIETLVSKDPANNQFRRYRALIALYQALAFAGWSTDPAISPAECRRRLTQAETYLAEAEEFFRAVKLKGDNRYLEMARAEVAAATAKLEGEGRAESKR